MSFSHNKLVLAALSAAETISQTANEEITYGLDNSKLGTMTIAHACTFAQSCCNATSSRRHGTTLDKTTMKTA
jgi:hypothetical protein